MGQARDYEVLIRELLAGVAGGWSYGRMTGWLMGKGIKDQDLAQWLREHGVALGTDAEGRGQLGCLAGLGRGELAEVAEELVKGWEPPQVDLFELGKYEEALAIYEQAIESNPSDYCAWCNRGSVVGKLGSLEEANACYERAIEIEPSYYHAWYFRGITLRDLERYEEAIFSYERAIEIDPVNYQVWLDRGIMFCDYLKKYEKALESFDQ